jgi:hypothetical protein
MRLWVIGSGSRELRAVVIVLADEATAHLEFIRARKRTKPGEGVKGEDAAKNV